MKIQLINDLSQLDDGQFLEVFPGPYKGRSWNDESVYIEDEAFALIEPIVVKHAPNFNRRSNNNIEKEVWAAILTDLENLKGRLENAASISDLKGLLGFQEEASEREFGLKFDDNLASLKKMVDGLIQWLNRELANKPVICILGI